MTSSDFPSARNLRDELAEAGDVGAKKALIGKWLDAGAHTSRAFWLYVEQAKGLEIGDWKFVADVNDVPRILRDGQLFSVREYGRRMRATSGAFFLGMDDPDHERDALTGEIIPGWDTYRPGAYDNPRELAAVTAVAATATRAVLAGLVRRTQLARLTAVHVPCQLTAAELLGVVLDECAARFFGIRAPSALSLIAWGRDVANYHFRVYADEHNDRSHALQASAVYRAHVLAAIAELDDPSRAPRPDQSALQEQRRALADCVSRLRKVLQQCPHAPRVSDDDVARNLIGILTGSLTASIKAFAEAILAQPRQADGRHIDWQRPDAASRFPCYDVFVAKPLGEHRRGSLDAVYRTYLGKVPLHLGEITVQPNDLVIVWLGGTLQSSPDNLFGIGMHKCPGMSMAKAILEGVLQVLSQFQGAHSPIPVVNDGDLYLAFDELPVLDPPRR